MRYCASARTLCVGVVDSTNVEEAYEDHHDDDDAPADDVDDDGRIHVRDVSAEHDEPVNDGQVLDKDAVDIVRHGNTVYVHRKNIHYLYGHSSAPL
jgi:hypothetical protein